MIANRNARAHANYQIYVIADFLKLHLSFFNSKNFNGANVIKPQIELITQTTTIIAETTATNSMTFSRFTSPQKESSKPAIDFP